MMHIYIAFHSFFTGTYLYCDKDDCKKIPEVPRSYWSLWIRNKCLWLVTYSLPLTL